MFRFHKTLDIVTLFHKASLPASVRAATILKQASAVAASTATEDQASDHTAQSQPRREEFQLDITENAPTADQLKTILEYAGQARIPSIVRGARTENEALKKFRESADNFQRPVVVDWNNGKVQAGDNESEILKMLNALPPKN